MAKKITPKEHFNRGVGRELLLKRQTNEQKQAISLISFWQFWGRKMAGFLEDFSRYNLARYKR